MSSAYETFVALHVPGDPLIIYNCWDPGSAVAIAKAGAKAVATGSFGAAESLGFHDGEQAPLDAVFDNARRIIGVVDLPVSIDFEGGYAVEPEGVAANHAKLAATGAVGCNFEDSVIGGEGVYPLAQQADRVRAARQGAGDAFYINARVDLYLRTPKDAHDGSLLDQAVERAQGYMAAGASGIFVPGLRDPAALAELVERTSARINVIPGSGQPTRELADAGVARISYGGGPWKAAMAWLEEQARPAIDWRG
ncbi:isocitrate lyase/phosphoenolpyruvate mutase family protein [Sphingomonas sp.]|jgi:2-methylisocitrate lyase-like PEP mutase family enzyme|uniref:isocitrate lyase/PEP mutase family protein n=1 Tax=Sphingomonas sp. TaxID=28214 RepID=UPI002E361875|nr:isocitrate lyase/phosphoenolpyruvate mutase family protein [Sphingomonas sp.]HEX4694399.1 isocitrate lyase/phosphoenolpyruvate mutase family protein [Sphingomonas sp.]